MKGYKSILLVILALLLVVTPACAPKEPASKPPVKYEAEFINLFDTLSRVIGYADSQEAFHQAVSDLKDDLEVYHQLYDIYKTYPGLTNLKDVNDRAGKGPVPVDRKIIDLLLYARQAYELTDGKVNIALGSVLRIWHDYRGQGIQDPSSARLPDRALLEEADLHARFEDLIIDEAAGTVELKDPLMSLDVGAVAKGYAVEQAALAAEERGVRHLLISVGGNVRAIGARNDQGDPWHVGIENPDHAVQDYLAILDIAGLSIVTSGVYERFYLVDGKAYHHIIDPDTLFPEDRYLSVSIVTTDSGMADVLSTALFNLDLEKGKALIERLEETEALWCLNDGVLVQSSGFAAYLKKTD